jgi:hypothetical protein
MTTVPYMQGRKKYQRPQGLLFANNSGTIVTSGGQSFYLPLGNEVGQDEYTGEGNEFMLLTDDNRGSIDFSSTRIEKRERTINGRMRSYHVADKLKISVSWDLIPSRAFSQNPNFDSDTGKTSLRSKPLRTGYLDPQRTVTLTYSSDEKYVNVGGLEYTYPDKVVTMPDKLVYLPGDIVWADEERTIAIRIPGQIYWDDQLVVKAREQEGSIFWEEQAKEELTVLPGNIYFDEQVNTKLVAVEKQVYWADETKTTKVVIPASVELAQVTETVRVKEPDQVVLAEQESLERVKEPSTVIISGEIEQVRVVEPDEIIVQEVTVQVRQRENENPYVLQPGDTVVVEGKTITLPQTKQYVARTATLTDTFTGTRATTQKSQQYTTDGGAGGVEILDWYERYTGSFWVYLSYDKYNNFDVLYSNGELDFDSRYNNIGKYNQVIEMFFADFSYSVQKRGGTDHDLWNISLTLEEA